MLRTLAFLVLSMFFSASAWAKEGTVSVERDRRSIVVTVHGAPAKAIYNTLDEAKEVTSEHRFHREGDVTIYSKAGPNISCNAIGRAFSCRFMINEVGETSGSWIHAFHERSPHLGAATSEGGSEYLNVTLRGKAAETLFYYALRDIRAAQGAGHLGRKIGENISCTQQIMTFTCLFGVSPEGELSPFTLGKSLY